MTSHVDKIGSDRNTHMAPICLCWSLLPVRLTTWWRHELCSSSWWHYDYVNISLSSSLRLSLGASLLYLFFLKLLLAVYDICASVYLCLFMCSVSVYEMCVSVFLYLLTFYLPSLSLTPRHPTSAWLFSFLAIQMLSVVSRSFQQFVTFSVVWEKFGVCLFNLDQVRLELLGTLNGYGVYIRLTFLSKQGAFEFWLTTAMACMSDWCFFQNKELLKFDWPRGSSLTQPPPSICVAHLTS